MHAGRGGIYMCTIHHICKFNMQNIYYIYIILINIAIHILGNMHAGYVYTMQEWIKTVYIQCHVHLDTMVPVGIPYIKVNNAYYFEQQGPLQLRIIDLLFWLQV